MQDETQQFVKVTDDKITPVIKQKLYNDDGNGSSSDSHIMNVSVRGWITIMLLFTVCLMCFREIKVVEPLYSLALLSAGFYFGTKSTPKQ